MAGRLYATYLAVLLTGVVLGPVVWAALVLLETPTMLGVLRSPRAPSLALLVLVLAMLVALILGRARGPVVLGPFRTHLLAGGPRPRRRALRRPFWKAAALPISVLAVLATVPVLALARAGDLAPWAVTAAPVVGALAGLLVAVCWLLGQASVGAGRRGLVVSLRVPRLLDALSGPVLLDQARRWQSATTALGAGEASAAVSAYRPVPRAAAPGDAIRSRSRSLPLIFLTRDLLAALRLPGRLTLGAVSVVLAVLVAGTTTVLPSGLWWLAIGLGSGLGYLGTGVLTDGVRHAVEAGAAPVLYGVGDLTLVGLHSLLPLLAAVGLGCAGLLGSVLLGGAVWSSVLGAGALVLAVAVRVYDAARPPMPLILLTPAPTAAGDVSGLAVALWQVDALLVVTLVPVAVGALVLAQGPGAGLVIVPAVALVLLAARRRLLG